jgi:hypothetical protein
MFRSPMPRIGDVVLGADATGRVLRVSAHPSSDRVVLSLWQDGVCLGTLRLAGEDVPHLVAVLTSAADAVALPDAPPTAPTLPITGQVRRAG